MFFNIFALEKNNYFNINIIFLKNYRLSKNNDFNIINFANRVILIALKEFLIIEDFDLKYNLIIEKANINLNLDIKIYIDSSYSRYSFANRLIFIIYK